MRLTPPTTLHPSPITQHLAKRSSGGDAALWIGIVLAGLAVALLGMTATAEPGGGMLLWALGAIVLGVLACGVLLWALAYRQLAYTLGEHALEITWCGHTVNVPYAAIEGVYTGQRLVGSATPTGLAWPGIYVGSGRARGLGRLRFFTTSPETAALTLITLEHSAVVVSARNPQDFRTALIERIRDAADESSGTSVTRLPPRTA